MMLFFDDCQTEQEAKNRFRKLCKHFHPDKGGDNDLMIELKKQYEVFKPNYSINYCNNDDNNSDLIKAYKNYIKILEKGVENKNLEIIHFQFIVSTIKKFTLQCRLLFLIFGEKYLSKIIG